MFHCRTNSLCLSCLLEFLVRPASGHHKSLVRSAKNTSPKVFFLRLTPGLKVARGRPHRSGSIFRCRAQNVAAAAEITGYRWSVFFFVFFSLRGPSSTRHEAGHTSDHELPSAGRTPTSAFLQPGRAPVNTRCHRETSTDAHA